MGPRELERVLIDALSRTEGDELIDRDDWVQLRSPALPFVNRNCVCVARLAPEQADARIAEVKREHQRRGAGFRWIVGPSSAPEDLSDRLERAGVPNIATALGMYMRVPEQVPEVPPDLEFELTTLANVEVYVDVNVRGWERGPAFGEEVAAFIRAEVDRTDQYSWIVRQDGEPVGATVIKLLGDLAYFQGGAVVPERRRRGLYLAMVHHRLALLRSLGIEHAVIWADRDSSAGVCERAGFEPRCQAHFHELRLD